MVFLLLVLSMLLTDMLLSNLTIHYFFNLGVAQGSGASFGAASVS